MPSPGIRSGALPPRKWWGNLGIRRLKPFVRKQNSKGMVGEALTHTRQRWAFLAGHLSHPTAQEGKKKNLCNLPTHLWDACSVLPPSRHQTPKTRAILPLGFMGSCSSETKGNFYTYGSGKEHTGLEFFRNHCMIFFFFNFVHLYYFITPFPKTSQSF